MKIKFKVIAIGERFQIAGKLYRKAALSLAQDENRIGHLMMADTEVEADESVNDNKRKYLGEGIKDGQIKRPKHLGQIPPARKEGVGNPKIE